MKVLIDADTLATLCEAAGKRTDELADLIRDVGDNESEEGAEDALKEYQTEQDDIHAALELARKPQAAPGDVHAALEKTIQRLQPGGVSQIRFALAEFVRIYAEGLPEAQRAGFITRWEGL